jgi:hypothetical protein
MGFPFENASWDSVSGVIFVGGTGGHTLVYSLIAIGICVAALLFGNGVEASKYKKHK